MSLGFIGLLVAVALLMVATVLAAVWMNRTPEIERDESEILPLFSAHATVADDDESDAPLIASDTPELDRAIASARDGRAAPPFATSSYGPPSATTPPMGAPHRATAEASLRTSPSPVMTSTATPSRPTATGAAAPVAKVVGTQTDRQLIKFSLPAEGTLQFLPGRLEIASGQDTGREIRFVRLPGPHGTEFTFGRSDGEAYRHIQLRDHTVSRSHARMRFHEGRWYLQSLSQTNPVVLNRRALTNDDERVLDDGARIEMGEVLFTFRNR